MFPGIAMALFLLYHVYIFASPTGFHLLALLVMFLLLFVAMVYTVRVYELPHFHRGDITEVTPR